MSGKRPKKVNRPRASGANRGAKVALLVALGLLIALVVVLARLTAEKNSQPIGSGETRTDARSVEKPAGKPTVSPEFEFYTLLPEQGNRLPRTEPEQSPTPSPPAADEPVLESGGRYLIQAGSFRGRKDAESRKAELALLGFESRVTAVDIRGESYFRVMVGPLAAKEAAEAQRRMQEADIEVMSPRRI
ncbi:SPOR domain-containing protein [Guyparkeria sp. 1SP6A2]|nr:SPOR domain-containing protein [Guyparkeria sp. 1SP6A2]